MEKYAVYKNNQEVGQFSTIINREDDDFLDEFYAMLMPMVPEAGNENLKNKIWSNLDEDFDFDVDGSHYSVKHLERLID